MNTRISYAYIEVWERHWIEDLEKIHGPIMSVNLETDTFRMEDGTHWRLRLPKQLPPPPEPTTHQNY